MQKKAYGYRSESLFEFSVSSLFFVLLCFALLYFWVLIRLKRYQEVQELLYREKNVYHIFIKWWKGEEEWKEKSYIKILFENILTFQKPFLK